MCIKIDASRIVAGLVAKFQQSFDHHVEYHVVNPSHPTAQLLARLELWKRRPLLLPAIAATTISCAGMDPMVGSCISAFGCGTDQACVRACVTHPFHRTGHVGYDDRGGGHGNGKEEGKYVKVWYSSVCKLRSKSFAINHAVVVYPDLVHEWMRVAEASARSRCTMQGGRMTSFRIDQFEFYDHEP